jgi:hypothetical protein
MRALHGGSLAYRAGVRSQIFVSSPESTFLSTGRSPPISVTYHHRCCKIISASLHAKSEVKNTHAAGLVRSRHAVQIYSRFVVYKHLAEHKHSVNTTNKSRH